MTSKQKKNDIEIAEKTSKLFAKISNVLAPPPDLTVSEWADKFRMLSREASAEAGQWVTDRAPHLRAIMDAATDPTVEEIIFKKCAQIGYTELLLNIIGYHIDYDPCPILMVQPTADVAERFSKQRLAPAFRDCPTISAKIGDPKARDGGQTLLLKEFPGGSLILTGANSAAGLRSLPIRIVLFDEVDGYPASAGSEGDPIMLGKKRAANFWNRKYVLGSTPTNKYTSRIDAAFESGTMERWSLPCPGCGTYQQLMWENLNRTDLTYQCKHCLESFGEFRWKQNLTRDGKYIAEKPHKKKIRSFHMNELSSPFRRWHEIVSDFEYAEEQAKMGNLEHMKAFVNTCLGECWDGSSETVSQDWLEEKREAYDAELPQGVQVLVAAVDVQDNRLEVLVKGFGTGKESWGIEYHVIHGDPARQSLWQSLDEYLLRYWTREDGVDLPISTTTIDSGGHFTDEVYKFCKARENRRVWPIKGHSTAGKPFVGKPTRSNRRKCALFPINVSTGKETLFARLKIGERGAGYCHYPQGRGFNSAFFKGLLSEKPVLKYKQGQRVIEWVHQPGTRNEPLDLEVYCLAALEILNPKLAGKRAEHRRSASKPQVTAEALEVLATPIQQPAIQQPAIQPQAPIVAQPKPQASAPRRRVLSRGLSL